MRFLIPKKDKQKVGVIILLFIVLILQTNKLWLGNASSHNFLEENTSYGTMIPSKIWMNKGSIYPLSNVQSEYFRIVEELSALIKEQSFRQEPIWVPSFKWDQVIGKQGILLEYEVSLGLDVIVGEPVVVGKPFLIDRVFVDMTNLIGGKIEVYFFNNVEEGAYQLTLQSQAIDFKKLYYSINTEGLISPMRYQASQSAVERFIKGNVYLPLVSKNSPIEYTSLYLSNEVNKQQDPSLYVEQLIGTFFLNPLTKSKEVLEDESIVFTENMRSIVTYRTQGVLEYINLAASEKALEMSALEGYTTAMHFIEQTPAMKPYKKQNIYLKKIEERNNQYTYFFDFIYEGYKVKMSEKARLELGVESMITLTVRNRQVISGKWSLLELKESAELKRSFTTEYIEAINEMYDYPQMQENEDVLLDKLECVYLIESIDRGIYLRWSALIDENRYYLRGR